MSSNHLVSTFILSWGHSYITLPKLREDCEGLLLSAAFPLSWFFPWRTIGEEAYWGSGELSLSRIGFKSVGVAEYSNYARQCDQGVGSPIQSRSTNLMSLLLLKDANSKSMQELSRYGDVCIQKPAVYCTGLCEVWYILRGVNLLLNLPSFILVFYGLATRLYLRSWVPGGLNSRVHLQAYVEFVGNVYDMTS
jgi:hypothetical protein